MLLEMNRFPGFPGEPVLLYAGSGVFDLALDNTCIIVYNYTR